MTKKLKPAQAPESVELSPVKDPEAQVQEWNGRVIDALAPKENFDPKSNLRSVASGVWRYLSNNPSSVKGADFESDLARQFGIKKNDIVFVVGNKQIKTIVV